MTREVEDEAVVERFASLRQHQRDGQRSPHKPLLVLLALGQIVATGRSDLAWSEAEVHLADLVAEFGRPSRTSRRQSAAYPFTRLRSDLVWVLDHDVPMDDVGPLADHHVTGRFEASVESALRDNPALLNRVAHLLVETQFPPTIAPDVLVAVGLDPDLVLRVGVGEPTVERRRDPRWRANILQAWDRQCAFCGYDGQIAGATAGIDAAHVRWFAFDGPDDLDNGLALCTLHHKLFDLGVLGLDEGHVIRVSAAFTARTPAGRMLYDLHGRELQPRPGTIPPGLQHVQWHGREVFKAEPIAI